MVAHIVSLPVRLIDYALRDYGTAKWEGGDPNCSHSLDARDGGKRADRTIAPGRNGVYKDVCGKCGAIRIDNQLGLEQSPEEYLANMVQVFREVWRVLRDDGTVWCNMGDGYNGSGGAGGDYALGGLKDGQPKYPGHHAANLKPKDLMMMPARLALALQADGWYLRSEIVWLKKSPMPESVRDRPTTATEKIYLLAKRARYYYDADAVREKTGTEMTLDEYTKKTSPGATWKSGGISMNAGQHKKDGGQSHPSGRNQWNYWLLSPEPCKFAHFATFPTEIPRRAIKAGTSAHGVCSACGAPWVRMVEKDFISTSTGRKNITGQEFMNGWDGVPRGSIKTTTLGWQPSCTCAADVIPATVLDPFAGSGTTGVVTRELGRRFVGLDLSYTYLHDIARKRLELDLLDAWQGDGGTQAESELGDLPLFGDVE